MKSRSVSVTGATGFLGWHIAAALRGAGWHVRAIVRPSSRKPTPDGIERIEAHLESGALARAAAGDVLVHAAGQTRGPRTDPFTINTSGTIAAIDAANAIGARLVHVSSQAAAGPSLPGRATREDDPPHPITAYGRSKLEGERLVQQRAAVPWTVLRPAAVYGPRDRAFLSLFRLAARGRFPLAAPPGAAFTLVHVDDVVRAVLMAAEGRRDSADRATIFIGHPTETTTEDVLRAIAAAVGRPYRPMRVPAFVLTMAAAAGELAWRVGREPSIDAARLAELRAARFVCDVTRARDLLGFVAAVPLDVGMGQTYGWYREHRWL